MVASKYTNSASGERASWEQLHAQIAAININANLLRVLQEAPDQILLLNGFRQIVYVNAPTLRGLNIQDPAEVYGCRVGEVVGCVHAEQGDGGCGTSKQCRFCGGLHAIMRCLDGYADVQRCRVECVERKKELTTLDFIVHSIPVRVAGLFLCLIRLGPPNGESPKQVAAATFRVQHYAALID